MRFVTEDCESFIQWISVEEILSSWKSVDTSCMRNRAEYKRTKNSRPIGKVLAAKRKDSSYEDTKQLIMENGFTQPLCFHKACKKQMDGHHRLAAAIELGYKYIPYIDGKGRIFLPYEYSKRNERLLHPENPDFSNSNKELEYA